MKVIVYKKGGRGWASRALEPLFATKEPALSLHFKIIDLDRFISRQPEIDLS